MMWPFNVIFGKADSRIKAAEVAASEARTYRYAKIFELDNAAEFNEMVSKSLNLMGRPNDPPAR